MVVALTSPSSSVVFTMALSLLIVGMVLSLPTMRRELEDPIGAAIEPDAQIKLVPLGSEDSAMLSELSGREGWGSPRRRRTAPTPPPPTTTTPPPPVNIRFGGDLHGNNRKDFPVVPSPPPPPPPFDWSRRRRSQPPPAYLLRPEVVKSEACDEKACYDCKTPKTCWHGWDDETWTPSGGWGSRRRGVAAWKEPLKKKLYGALALTLPGVAIGTDISYTSYIAEVYASCPSTGAKQKWSLDIYELTNGRLDIYTDLETTGQLVILKKILPFTPSYWKKLETVDLTDKVKKETRIRSAFYPDDRSKESKAVIMLTAAAVSAHVDECMIVKTCLKILGDGSDAGFELRNVNEYQLACLEQTHLPIELQAKCEPWNTCMENTTKMKPLKAFLRAALQNKKEKSGKKKKSLAAIASNVTQKGHLIPTQALGNVIKHLFDPNTCIDPAVDDAESYDCECLGSMVDDCSDSSDSLEVCLRKTMCKIDVVCARWKKINCPGYTDELFQKAVRTDSSGFSAMEVRRQVSTKSDALASLNTGIDGALQGKCSQ